MFNILIADDDINICANRELLSQVWINLINNAIKYANSKISIKLSVNSDIATIEFKNDGGNLSNQQVEHIFDKFYQTDKSHASNGFGLGLSIAKKIIDLHQGSIICNNSHKNQTIFIITLPLE